MKTVTIEVKNNNAYKLLQDLELNDIIRIINEPELVSYALPGSPADIKAFQAWIANTEKETTISLTEAKSKWQLQKRKLQKSIK